MDNAALGVDFRRVEGEVAAPVVENHKARVLNALARHGHLRDVVDCLVEAGVGVEVVAEFHTDAFKPVDNHFSGEVGRAVEAHVLKEVGETALVVFLKDRAYLLGDEEVSLTLGHLVVADEVGQSVVEFACTNQRVKRHRGHLRHPRLLGCYGHCAADQQRGGRENPENHFSHDVIV